MPQDEQVIAIKALPAGQSQLRISINWVQVPHPRRRRGCGETSQDHLHWHATNAGKNVVGARWLDEGDGEGGNVNHE